MAILYVIFISILGGCYNSPSEKEEKKTAVFFLESVIDIDEEFSAPHLLMFGDEEAASIVSEDFLERQKIIKEDYQIEYDQSLGTEIKLQDYIGGIINETLYSAINETLVLLSDDQVSLLEKDPSVLNGSILHRFRTADSYKLYPSRTEINAQMLRYEVSKEDTISANKNQLFEKDTTEIEITNNKSLLYRFWRKIQNVQKIFQHLKEPDAAYFSRAIKQKKADSSYAKYNQMGNINLSSRLKDKLSDDQISQIEANIFNKGETMTLGMLPKKGLLQDIDRNNKARQNIKDIFFNKTIEGEDSFDEYVKDIDSFKVALLDLGPEEIKAIREGTSYSILKGTYNKYKEQLGEEAFENVLDSNKIEAEKRLEAAIDFNSAEVGRNKTESIDYKDSIQENIDNLRQSLANLDKEQIETFKNLKFEEAGSASDLLKLSEEQKNYIALSAPNLLKSLDDQQNDTALVTDVMSSLIFTYINYKVIFGDDIINNIVIPRQIPGYKSDTQNFSVASIVESFELDNFLRKRSENNTVVEGGYLGEGRYKVNIESSELRNNLGVDNVNLTQFSTRDRTAMTPLLVNSAINYLRSAINEGKKTFVHCKSGKGRSATIVVGTRADIILNEINTSNPSISLSRKEITELVNDQVKQVQERRPMVGVSQPQKTVLVDTLFERQKVRLNLK